MMTLRGEVARSSVLSLARARIGPSLRSILLFGSCLSPRTTTRTSIPDLFAIVDDVDATLRHMGVGTMARLAARALPPITLALRAFDGGPSLAKLNLVDPRTASQQLATLPDLYLAARLGKKVVVVFARDTACTAEVDVITQHARAAMAGVALRGLRRRASIEHVIERCIAISYRAEPRPERPAKIAALFAAFAAEYRALFAPLVVAIALQRGITLERDELVDLRDDHRRAAEQIELQRLLWRSRLRMMARWPKQMLVYRGWLPYVIQKLRRAWLG